MNRTFSKTDTNILKGLAILLMMMHHCFLNESRFIDYPISFWPFDSKEIIRIALSGKCCVGIFVFLSAYGMSCTFLKNNKQLHFSSKQATSMTLRRLLNLYSGFWIAYIFVFVVSWLLPNINTFGYYVTSNTDLTNPYKTSIQIGTYMILDLFGIGDIITGKTLIGTWWYMGFAVCLIVFFPLIIKAYQICGIFLVPAVALSIAFFELPVTNYTRFLLLVPLGIYCAEKNLLARIKEFRIFRNSVFDIFIKFLLITILLYLFEYDFVNNYSPLNFYTPIRDMIVVFLYILWGYLFLTEIPGLRTVLELLGKHSMNIFLIHSFIRGRWFIDHTYSFPHFLLVILVLLVESLLISVVLEFLKSITGYNKLIKKIASSL